MIDPIEADIQRKLDQNKKEDGAGMRAAATPLPGVLRDVFALAPSIRAGPWEVRPFYDADFEFLQMLEHPLHKMMLGAMEGKENNDDYIPRGAVAWEVCWIMTRPVELTDELLRKPEGRMQLQEKAREEFSKLQLGALIALNTAILQQMSVYWSPTLGYGTPSTGAEGEQRPNPPSSVPPLTGSAG